MVDAVEASTAMDSASSLSPEVGPTEDTVQALLDYMVDPVLPFKSSVRDAPSRSQQQLVAKQVHAVALLYNYYHRKHYPALEFLGFESFCKLAIILKPTLMAHMKLMHRSDYTELDDVENHISLTEKAIMDACDISSALDASKDVPVIEGWPISKVAVLLVDSRRENCLLFFDSITSGVWSVIEKDLDAFNGSSECAVKGKHVTKRKRITRKLLKEEPGADEARLKELMFSAVKEAAGINQTDLMVLESHVVYSLSKEKTAARFYIVQCTQPNCEDLQIPIKDVIGSLQGALVKKISCGWTVTPAVKYFHLLPYAGILSDWISREVFSNSLQDIRVEVKNIEMNSSHPIENTQDKEVTDIRDKPTSNQASRTSSLSPNQKDNHGGRATSLSNFADGPYNMDANGSYMASPQNEDKVTVKEGLVKVNSVINPCIAECRGEGVRIEDKFCSIISPDQDGSPAGDGAPVPSNPNYNFLEKRQVTLASKENTMSQSAFRFLYKKREKLAHQLRNLEDEIALCDRDIQTVQYGDEIDLALVIDTIINCSDVNSEAETQDKNYQHVEDQYTPQCTERKKLSEAILTSRNPCQELDDICNVNYWKLPTYCVSPSDGKYVAQITVEGMDFKFSVRSEVHGCPREARESAAAKTLAKLRYMVSSQ